MIRKEFAKKYGDEALARIRIRDREYQKNKRKESKGYKTKESIEYSKKHPERIKAYTKLQYALKKGKIKRKNYCEKCKIKIKTHGHHEDYLMPYDVIWLCNSCHKLRHNNYVKKVVS